MRPTGWRRVAFGLFLLPLLGVGALAQLPADPHADKNANNSKWQPAAAIQPSEPPASLPRLQTTSPPKLKADTAALAEERQSIDDGSSAERARLYAKLSSLLDKINSGAGPAPQPRPVEPHPPTKSKIEVEGGKTVDSLRLAMNLFRDNDLDAALRAFRGMDLVQLTREDRAFVRYMTASCQRRLGKVSEAAALYREIADAQEDAFFAECAVSQLALIRTGQELEVQIEQLRARAKTR